MRSGVAAIVVGAGVAIASAFASSWGLSTALQRTLSVVGVLLAIFGVGLLIDSWRGLSKSVTERDGQGDRSIRTEHQSGGVNITGDIYIQSPRPGVRASVAADNVAMDNGTYRSTILIENRAGYAANGLVIEAHGSRIREMFVQPSQGGTITVSALGTDTAVRAGRRVHGPLGPQYTASVWTDQPDNIQFDVRLET
jgi:hypothetical protein